MICQARKKNHNKICSNRERDPRLAPELTIFQPTLRFYLPRTEDADKKPLLWPLTRHSFLAKGADVNSVPLFFEHRFDLIALLRTVRLPVCSDCVLHPRIEP